MTSGALRVKGLEHSYGDRLTFRELDLEVQDGQILAVLGASGCGKTTLLRCIAGFEHPAAGSIALGDRPLVEAGRERVRAEARRIGIVFQDYALFPHMSVLENIAFGIRHSEGRRQRAIALLHWVGLSAFEGREPHSLSGGQQQRVALARAMAPDPALLLLDEPFANVDASRRIRLILELKERLRERGVATLLVTHDRTEALGLADQVAVMVETPDGGRISQRGSPESVYRCPVDARVAGMTGEAAFVDAQAEGMQASGPFGVWPLANEAQGAVRLLIRPESLRFESEENGRTTVLSNEFLGRGWRMHCETPAGRLCVENRERTPAGTKGNVSAPEPLWALPVEGADVT
jgi:iron(III) transport system ATP-binding protein